MHYKKTTVLVASFFAILLTLPATDSGDPVDPYLDGKAPEILREIPATNAVPENITLRQVVFRSRDSSEIFAVIATPKASGKHPGMLVLHGGGGSAEVEKAMAWARRGYVAVAPDLPGIGDPKKIILSQGRWSSLKYGEGRWTANPDASASVLFDAVLSAMKSLYLLRIQPDVDPARVGVVGISWGGYMTTMVCGLAGSQVRAGFAVFGCGFYELTTSQGNLSKMPENERAQWLKYLDPGRRVSGMKSAFFIAGAANDFFFYPPAVQATLDAVPGEKNHLYAPNANHKVPLPGGTVFSVPPKEAFKPTPFQPYPTPAGGKANWLAMEVPYFDYYLQGRGEPLPRVIVQSALDSRQLRLQIKAPHPLTQVWIYWAKPDPDVKKRLWTALPTVKTASDIYEAALPVEASNWFAVASDDRPVTVSSDYMTLSLPSK